MSAGVTQLEFALEPPRQRARNEYTWRHRDAACWRHLWRTVQYQPREAKRIILDILEPGLWVGFIDISQATEMPTDCVNNLLGQMVRQKRLETAPLYFLPVRKVGELKFERATMEERLVMPPIDASYRGFEFGFRRLR